MAIIVAEPDGTNWACAISQRWNTASTRRDLRCRIVAAHRGTGTCLVGIFASRLCVVRSPSLHLSALQDLASRSQALRDVAQSPRWMLLAVIGALSHLLGGLWHPQLEWSGVFGVSVFFAVATLVATAVMLGSVARASEYFARLLASIGFGGHLYLAWCPPCLSPASARHTCATPVVPVEDPSRPVWPRP
jgi:hypothetical protein